MEEYLMDDCGYCCNCCLANNEVTQMPRIGDKAPEFKAVTTQGDIDFLNSMKVVG